MSDVVQSNDFVTQFTRLSEHNQKYIIAIQQALMYAQETEKEAQEKRSVREYERVGSVRL